MPAYNLYLGNPSFDVFLWRSTGTVTTSFGKNAGCTFSSNTSSGPDNGVVVTLPADEYPVSFRAISDTSQGYIGNWGYGSETAQFYLCDSNGQNEYFLNTITCSARDPHSGAGGGDMGRLTQSGAWKNLAGKTLAMKKKPHTGGDGWDVCFIGQVVFQVNTLKHGITWTDPSLSFSQNEYVLTVTMGGSASDSWGGTPRYDLLMDGVYAGSFSSGQATVTLTDSQLEIPHTFALVAVSTVNGHTISATGTTVSHTPHSVHKTMKYWDGTSWVECYANVYDNGQWQEVEPFYYDGNSWVPCSQT